MSIGVFEQRFHAIWESILHRAVDDVSNIERASFLNGNIDKHIENIEKRHSLEIARLDIEHITAKRKSVENFGRDAWGDMRTTQSIVLDVSVPILGDSQTVKFRPSRCTVPNQRSEIRGGALCFTIADDDNADRQVKAFTNLVSENLNYLRTEYEQVRHQLGEAIKAAAQSRKAQIDAEVARDKTRSFKIID